MNNAPSLFKWLLRFGLLFVLFLAFFLIGSIAVAAVMPDAATSEPGLVPPAAGLLIIALVNVIVIAALILTSRWGGWKLAVSLALAYYGAVTVLPQIETWYFLSSISVDRRLLPRLFLMGFPTAFLFVPLAVWILGKGRSTASASSGSALALPAHEWIWKLALLAVAYVVLYWSAGYFIAWQNPELRAFYGQPGEPVPFFTHTANTLRQDPSIFALQFGRAFLWMLCALPIIRGSRVNRWGTALVVGLLFGVPQNVAQILANPLMPIASVRSSHMIETASSTFLFGVLVVWLLYGEPRADGGRRPNPV
jgi:hypothetical protein